MAVFAIHSYRPLPGRAGDLLASIGAAKPIMERNGAVVSVWQPIAGGEAGTLSIVDAYAGLGDYGRAMDALRKDPEWQAFWAGVMADPSGVNVDNYVLADLDATQGLPTVPSTVIASFTFRTRPGRLADHLAAQATACAHIARLGGNARTVQAIGRQAGAIGTIVGYEDFTHYGEFGEKLSVDEGWAGFWATVSADPPAEQVDNGLAALLTLPE